jgi:TPR repeat protein
MQMAYLGLVIVRKKRIGVNKGEHKAFVYYQKSADMGNANGMSNCFRNGIGVTRNMQKANYWYQI